MAWNEPGNGGRDPWGNRQGDGPPDLDEAFKKLQDNLGKMFGGGGQSNGGQRSGGNPVSKSLFGLALAGAAIVYGMMGVYTLDEQERGVVLRLSLIHI